MNRDPWSNEQLRFVRQLHDSNAFHSTGDRMGWIERLLWATAFIVVLVLLVTD